MLVYIYINAMESAKLSCTVQSLSQEVDSSTHELYGAICSIRNSSLAFNMQIFLV